MGEQAGAGPPLLDRQVRCGRLQHGLAGPAGIARPDVANDLQSRRDLLQHLGHILAELRQTLGIGAAAAAGEYRLVQHRLARQMRGQRLAQRGTARRAGLALRPGLGLRRGGSLGLILLGIADQHLELADLGRELLRRLAVAVPPQRGELHLQLLDLETRVA